MRRRARGSHRCFVGAASHSVVTMGRDTAAGASRAASKTRAASRAASSASGAPGGGFGGYVRRATTTID